MAKLFALAFAGLVAAVTLLADGPAADARGDASCSATVDDAELVAHGEPDDPIHVDKDDTVALALTLTQGTVQADEVTVRIESGPFSRTIEPEGQVTATGWQGTVDVSDYSGNGVGLYQVSLVAGEVCEVGGWVEVDGNPLATVTGAAAAAVLAVGVLGIGIGLIRAITSGGGTWWVILGGVATGIGACVLAWQIGSELTIPGVEPLSFGSFAIWTAPPVLLGTVSQRGLSVLGRSRSAEREFLEATRPPREAAPTDGGRPPMAEPVGEDGGELTTAEPPEAAMAGTADERDPPRTAYGLLQCPDAVVADEEFELTAGLAAEPTAGVAGEPLIRPATSIGAYTLTVQIVADGFDLRPGESWRHDLRVTADEAYPTFALHLTPAAQEEPVKPRAIQALYSTQGQTMGFAVRPVAVVRSEDLVADATSGPAEASGIAVPTDATPPDVTVRIQLAESESEGRLLWTLDTPYQDIDLPDAPLVTDIGDEPEVFARRLVETVGVREAQPGLYAYLMGVGNSIADNIPPAFWDVLRAAAMRVDGRPLTLFILSEEPYIPWELAVVDPPFDDSAPPILGAQAATGRWVLGQRRPKLPPPIEVQVGSMAVISGIYDQPGWSRLVEAEQEAAALGQSYGAHAVKAATSDVLKCFEGIPEADLLHFAVHGIYDPNSVLNGLVLVDGSTLDPFQVRGSKLAQAPFVFLNACQVGSANKMLGDYAGLAEAFLYAGASGVVAPLWSVKDRLAREIALRFYEGSFAGLTPAEILRRERATFQEDDENASATPLSYLFYGHPNMRLQRRDS